MIATHRSCGAEDACGRFSPPLGQRAGFLLAGRSCSDPPLLRPRVLRPPRLHLDDAGILLELDSVDRERLGHELAHLVGTVRARRRANGGARRARRQAAAAGQSHLRLTPGREERGEVLPGGGVERSLIADDLRRVVRWRASCVRSKRRVCAASNAAGCPRSGHVCRGRRRMRLPAGAGGRETIGSTCATASAGSPACPILNFGTDSTLAAASSRRSAGGDESAIVVGWMRAKSRRQQATWQQGQQTCWPAASQHPF